MFFSAARHARRASALARNSSSTEASSQAAQGVSANEETRGRVLGQIGYDSLNLSRFGAKPVLAPTIFVATGSIRRWRVNAHLRHRPCKLSMSGLSTFFPPRLRTPKSVNYSIEGIICSL